MIAGRASCLMADRLNWMHTTGKLAHQDFGGGQVIPMLPVVWGSKAMPLKCVVSCCE